MPCKGLTGIERENVLSNALLCHIKRIYDDNENDDDDDEACNGRSLFEVQCSNCIRVIC